MRHPKSPVRRRGSTMILVVSMLVLLVIIAAAFVSRAQSLRVLSSAQQLTAAQTDRIGPIAHAVTEEIAQSLFVQPIDPTDAALSHPTAATRTASSAVPRINPNSMETRYSIDLLDRMNNFTLAADADGDGSIDGYNFAPYEVRPWTNWPDVYNFSPVGDIRNVEGNPLGNPSFGDSRWLRSTEPIRLIYDSTAPDSTPADSDPHPDTTLPPIPVFSHWSHLSWIPTANNGWRLVRDISDLAKFTLVDVAPSQSASEFFPNPAKRWGLEVPYEQWLPSTPPDPTVWVPHTFDRTHSPAYDPAATILPSPVPPYPNTTTPQGDLALTFQQLAFGTTPVGNPNGGWFSSAHAQALSNTQTVLPNFLRLKWFGPRADEYSKDSPRNIITRTLCDSDGDGFTDSFWFLAPPSLDRSIRHVVGVSVVDNCALLNINIATRFDPATTGGKTPSDLALVSRQSAPALPAGAQPEIVPPGNAYSWADRRVEPVGDNAVLYPHEVGFLSSPLNTAKGTTYPASVLPAVPVNRFVVNFDPERFGSPVAGAAIPANSKNPTLLSEIGVVTTTTAPNSPVAVSAFPKYLRSDLERTNYFKAMSAGGELESYFTFAQPLSDAREMAWGHGQLANHFVDPSIATPVVRTTSQAPIMLDPFTMADELELRAFTGHNNPYVRTRLERALETDILESAASVSSIDTKRQILRSAMNREESSEFFDQLDASQLLLDNRRKLTTVSGARNEMMPPWLWTLPPVAVPNCVVLGPLGIMERTWQNAVLGSQVTYCGPDFVARPALQAGANSFLQFPGGGGVVAGDANCDSIVDQNDDEIARRQFLQWNRKVDLNRELTGSTLKDFTEQQLDQARDITKVLRKSLIDSVLDQESGADPREGDIPGEGTVRSVFSDLQVIQTVPPVDPPWEKSIADMDPDGIGGRVGSFTKSRRAVASWTANILAALDGPRQFQTSGGLTPFEDHPLHPKYGIIPNDYRGDPARYYEDPSLMIEPKSEIPVGYAEPTQIFIGQEKQPFIVQAFFAVVYPRTGTIPAGTPGSGEGYVNYRDSIADRARVIAVVQIANPYNTPISLAPFHLTVCDDGARTRDFYFDPSRDPRMTDPAVPPAARPLYDGWNYGPEPILGPATEEGPRTAIVYSIPLDMSIGDGRPDLVLCPNPASLSTPCTTPPTIAQYPVRHFRSSMLDFLDLSHSLHDPTQAPTSAGQPYERFERELNAAGVRSANDGGPVLIMPMGGYDLFETSSTSYPDTLLFNATGTALNTPVAEQPDWGSRVWAWHPRTYKQWLRGHANSGIVELVRTIPDPMFPDNRLLDAKVVVDRLVNTYSFSDDPAFSNPVRASLDQLFGVDIADTTDVGSTEVPPKWRCDPQSTNDFYRVNIGNNHFLMNWIRISRPWTVDVDGNNAITSNERAPRFVFAGLPTILRARPTSDTDEWDFPQLVTNLVQGDSKPFSGSAFSFDNYSALSVPVPSIPALADEIVLVPPADEQESSLTYRLPVRPLNSSGIDLRGTAITSKPTNFTLRTVLSPNGRFRLYPAWGSAIVGGAAWPGVPGPNALFEIYGDTGAGIPIADNQLTDTDCDGTTDLTDTDDDGDGLLDPTPVLANDPDFDGDGIANEYDFPESALAIRAYCRYPLRMTQRDGPFEQIAEVLDVPVWGPVIEAAGAGWHTIATYGEVMVGKRHTGGLAGPGAVLEGNRKGNLDQDYPTLTAPVFQLPTIDPNNPCTTPQLDERETMRFVVNRKAASLLNAGLPAGASILDGFTLDGTGSPRIEPTTAGRLAAEQRRLRLAAGFTGASTQGLLNVNTAPIEVLRALPNLQQLSYNNEAPGLDATVRPTISMASPPALAFDRSPPNWVRIPESIVNYRERFFPDGLASATMPQYYFPTGPKYWDRGLSFDNQFLLRNRASRFHTDMRSQRGFVSVGELALIDRAFTPLSPPPGSNPRDPNAAFDPESSWYNNFVIEPNTLQAGTRWDRNNSWSMEYAGLDPYRINQSPFPRTPTPDVDPAHDSPPPVPDNGGYRNPSAGGGFSAQLATDRLGQTVLEFDSSGTLALDPVLDAVIVAGDQAERNTMLKGIANLVTTRSDVFTVYLKIRSVAQNPATGVWDATDSSTLINEARYVMVVDRSNVDRPGQQPKILMFEKIVE